MTTPDEALRDLSERRWRHALALTVTMLLIYFGFIALAAYAKDLMGQQIVGGLSVGIVLGAFVIISAFVLTGIYIRWANTHYDPALEAIRKSLAHPPSGDLK